MQEEFWMPLVDEPIGGIVARIEVEHDDIRALVDSPRKLLAFRTFAYIRVGVVLGELLVERDDLDEGAETWVARLVADPEVWERLVTEVRQVAREVAAEAAVDPVELDPGARERFREFAKRALMDE